MSDYGVRWDAGKEPPDPCEYPEHEEADHCRCCRCMDCRLEWYYRFEEGI